MFGGLKILGKLSQTYKLYNNRNSSKVIFNLICAAFERWIDFLRLLLLVVSIFCY
jgi:hypothetical protein